MRASEGETESVKIREIVELLYSGPTASVHSHLMVKFKKLCSIQRLGRDQSCKARTDFADDFQGKLSALQPLFSQHEIDLKYSVFTEPTLLKWVLPETNGFHFPTVEANLEKAAFIFKIGSAVVVSFCANVTFLNVFSSDVATRGVGASGAVWVGSWAGPGVWFRLLTFS